MSDTFNQIEFPIHYYWGRYRRHIQAGLLIILALWFISSILYIVNADEEGVVLRFGQYLKPTQPPGLHAKLPWPIETVYIVPVQKIQSIEFGFATITPGRVTRYAPASEEQETVARMLTGDLNLAHVEWVVQYRIKDAYKYLFKIGGDSDPNLSMNDMIGSVSESVMRKLVGDASVDEVITIGRDEIATQAKDEIQEMLDGFETGVDIVTVKLQSATPPEAVKDAFDEVNRARQNKERVINEARGMLNSKIPAARGKRDQMISEAEGYKARVVMTMKGRVNAFQAQLAEYEKAPEVTRTRLYLATMEKILSQMDSKIVIDESVRGLLPLLDLGADGPVGPSQKGGAR